MLARILPRFRITFDTLTAEQYFINQRDCNNTRQTIQIDLKPLENQNQAFGSSDEILLKGCPFGTPTNEFPHYDTFQSVTNQLHPDLIFVQMDPSAYIARQRFLAHKSALHEVEGYEMHDAKYLDPWKPYNWEECVVNNFVLDMLDQNTIFDKLNVRTGFASYAYPSIQSQEIREVNKGKLIDTITKHIVHRKFSPYHTINKVLYTALTTRHKVLLGDMPEHLLRIQLGNVLQISEVRDLFRFVLSQVKEIQFPISFRKATLDLLPHVFQTPRDLYMTAMLKRSFQTAQNIAAFVGIHHAAPMASYWLPPPQGINYTEATRIPPRIPNETDEQLIEKQAIFEVMLETTIWAEPYLSNPFPYLVKDITKCSKEELAGMKKSFFDYYTKYNAFKLQLQKELPHFKNHSDVLLLETSHDILKLPGYQEGMNINAFNAYKEQQRKAREEITQR